MRQTHSRLLVLLLLGVCSFSSGRLTHPHHGSADAHPQEQEQHQRNNKQEKHLNIFHRRQQMEKERLLRQGQEDHTTPIEESETTPRRNNLDTVRMFAAGKDPHGDAIVREVSQKINRGEAVAGQITLGEAEEEKPHHRRSLNKRHQQRALHQERSEAREAKALAALQRELTFKLIVPPRKNPKTAFVKQAPSESDLALKGPMQPNCAWQAYITGKQYNVAYPDLQAVYQVLVMMNVNDKKIFRIKGTFPTNGVRYFSLQSNNPKAGFPISTIKDYEIVPDAGSGRNPYASNDTSIKTGTYTIYVTPRGDQGFPNELALCPDSWPDSQCRTMNAVMLMRFYTADPDKGVANSNTDPSPGSSNPRLFGYAGAPVVEERTITSWNGDRSKDKYRVFAPCDQARPTKITSMITNHFSEMIPPWSDPIRHNRKNNFVLYLGEDAAEADTAKAGVYPNLDAAYLLAIGWQKQQGIPAGSRLIAKVTGTLPTTARNLNSDPPIAEWQAYDVRYASFSSIVMAEGGPTCDTIDDAAMWRFYDPQKTLNWDRKFSFVLAPSKGQTCDIYDETTDMFLSSSLDGVAQDYFAILDRQLVPSHTHDHLPDKSNGYARIKCAEVGGKKCVDPAFLEGLLEEFYPKIDWYYCDSTGIAKQIDYFQVPLAPM